MSQEDCARLREKSGRREKYALVLVRRMEVVCGGESFTATGIPCRRELWTLGVVNVIKRERNQAIALALRGECNEIQYCWIFMCHVKCLEP
jgi:hypothetical protein